MTRPYLHFLPSQELLEEVKSIGSEIGLTDADITRQLCTCGLEQFRQGNFTFKMPGKSKHNNGGPDRRYLRNTGRLISKKKGGQTSKVGDIRNDKARLEHPLLSGSDIL